MAETDLKTFNCDAFAKDLAGQASQVIPADVNNEDKEFIVNIIFRFCKIPSLNFGSMPALIISTDL